MGNSPHKSADCQQSRNSTTADKKHDIGGVPAQRWVVMKAIEKNLIDWRADLVLRCFHEAQAQVAARVAHVVKVARHLSVGRENHDAAGMHELLLIRVVPIAESN